MQNTVSLHTITKYYAGFSNDEDRKNSASGGICAAIYQMGLKEGYKVFGVIQEENFQAKYNSNQYLVSLRSNDMRLLP